jgi:hypothetical protein
MTASGTTARLARANVLQPITAMLAPGSDALGRVDANVTECSRSAPLR